jgi:hypothetical protein
LYGQKNEFDLSIYLSKNASNSYTTLKDNLKLPKEKGIRKHDNFIKIVELLLHNTNNQNWQKVTHVL